MCQSANLQPLENSCAHKCETRKEIDKKTNKLCQKRVLAFLDGAGGLVAEWEAVEVSSLSLVKPIPTGHSPKELLPSVATKPPKCNSLKKIPLQM